VNVLWGFVNFVFAYLLLLRVGYFDPRSIAGIVPFAAGALLISLFSARHFGQSHGGNTRSTHEESALQSFPRSGDFNFRLWTAGGLVSNIGTWMQRVATRLDCADALTHHDATAVGIVTGPAIRSQCCYCLEWFGSGPFQPAQAADADASIHGCACDRAGILTISGYVRLWHVYVFAFVFGAAAALDAPVRQPLLGSWWRRTVAQCGRT